MPKPTPWLEELPKFEGRFCWMYLDGDGNVTAGVGCRLATRDDAVIAFADPAAAAQWDAIKALKPGMGPHFYEVHSTVRLTDRQVDDLLYKTSNWAGIRLQGLVPASVAWPVCVQDACKDIVFNTGSLNFPHMIAAIVAGNWRQAAKMSHRIEIPAPNGIQPARNEWTRDSILAALPEAA